MFIRRYIFVIHGGMAEWLIATDFIICGVIAPKFESLLLRNIKPRIQSGLFFVVID